MKLKLLSILFLITTSPIFTQNLLKDIYPGLVGNTSSNPRGFTQLNEQQFLFVADDIDVGAELFISDGSTGGTSLLTNIFVGQNDAFEPNNVELVQFQDMVIMRATNGTNGRELWKSDGTEAGTKLIADINSGGAHSDPAWFFVLPDFVVFIADDGIHGRELWRTDGTEAGTQLIKDIHSGTNHAFTTNPNIDIALIDNVLYFSANDGNSGFEIWRSDGTEAGTWMVADIFAGPNDSNTSDFTKSGDFIYFSALGDNVGQELYRTTGTAGSAELVEDILEGSGSSSPKELTDINGKLFFTATTGDMGAELFTYSPTEGIQLIDIFEGAGSSFPENFQVVNGQLLFRAEMPDSGGELWRSDGTEAGTQLVKDIFVGSSDGLLAGNSQFFVHNDTLYFSARDGGPTANGNFALELWISDGTTEGTTILHDLNAGENGSDPKRFFFFCNRIYFNATVGDIDSEPWYLGPEKMTTPITEINSDFQIRAPFPSPSASSVFLDIELKKQSKIHLEARNILGQSVAEIFNGTLQSGTHQLIWGQPNVQAGQYFLILSVDDKKISFPVFLK